ncbi:MAG: hypothetical protein CUN55_00675 [Phototrophicales bacterium]|nr:MAG: hypothetical protein CUN55_00675 [Phototrophicales bacterium]
MIKGSPYDPNNDERQHFERLGGEPAPEISPEEFAHLRQNGEIHIDPRGRVRPNRHYAEPSRGGVVLKKRRAWY